MEAFRRAGFDVIALLNEPSAAGLEYAHRYRSTLTSKRERVVVYDLGGGRSTHRSSGWPDFITTWFPRPESRGWEETISTRSSREPPFGRAACPRRNFPRLSRPPRRAVPADQGGAGSEHPADHGRSQGVPWRRRADRVRDVPGRRVLRRLRSARRADSRGGGRDSQGRDGAAGRGRVETELAGIYVVGGASALPLVGRMLRERFGRRMHRSPYPFAATAIGLAIAADEDAGFVLTDQLSRHFGVFREAEHGTRITFDPIFTKDVRLPGRAGGTLVSRRTYHAVHNVGHFRYAECLSLDEETGAPRGDLVPFADIHFPFDESLRNGGTRLDATPVRRMEGEGPRIEERYSVDANGIIEVTISDLGSGYSKTHRLAG